MKSLKNICDFFRYGLRNLVWLFPVVWGFRSWDWSFSLRLFRAGLFRLYQVLERGMEIDETRLPKVAALARVLTILDHLIEDDYIRLAEQEKGALSPGDWFRAEPVSGRSRLMELVENRSDDAQNHDQTVLDYARDLEAQEWTELWQILAGSDDMPGSDLRGWWD
jgi:hypothetical protein